MHMDLALAQVLPLFKKKIIIFAQTPMPEELQNKTVTILCNDCQTKGTVPFHVLGFK